uniref:Uncharacterized protein n=1 Tax=Arundo donax TaxID=35708 RepID=A0A0A9A1Q9_ARUDO
MALDAWKVCLTTQQMRVICTATVLTTASCDTKTEADNAEAP